MSYIHGQAITSDRIVVTNKNIYKILFKKAKNSYHYYYYYYSFCALLC